MRATQSHIEWVPWDLSPGLNQSELKAVFILSSTVLNHGWSYVSTRYAFMAFTGTIVP